MSTPVLIAIIAGGALLALLVVVLVVRGRRGGGGPPRVCGGCSRVLGAGWAQCLFCGWTPVPRLKFIGGPLAGQVMDLSAEVTTIGSVAGNTVILPDPAVSRKHAGIRRDGASYELADLGSTNGVYVNGHKMAKKQLVPGDVVRVGNTEMVFTQE